MNHERSIMENLLPEITEELKPLLPPIFGRSLKKKKKRGKKAKKVKGKILVDVELRNKASSIISDDSPDFWQSKYRTSRLTQLSNYQPVVKANKNLRSISNFSVLSNINRSQRLSFDHSQNKGYDEASLCIRSELHLPNINKSAVISFDLNLHLSGNKKQLIGRADYFKSTEERKKESKEVALGTDLLSDSDKLSCDDPINEYFDAQDRLNMRRSSFDSQRN
jgi:hypothetical protein